MQEAAGSVEQSINLQKQEESIEKEIAKKEDVSLDKTEDGKKIQNFKVRIFKLMKAKLIQIQDRKSVV